MAIEEQQTLEWVMLYRQIREATSSEPVAIAILQEVGKTRRAVMCNQAEKSEMPRERSGDMPATGKQLAYLKSLGIKPKQGLTKQEASQLIDQHNGVKATYAE